MGDESVYDIKNATLAVLNQMDEPTKLSFVNIAKNHFKVEDVDLTTKNIQEFLVNDGYIGLEFHLKIFLGKNKWDDLESEETKRILDHDLYNGGLSG